MRHVHVRVNLTFIFQIIWLGEFEDVTKHLRQIV